MPRRISGGMEGHRKCTQLLPPHLAALAPDARHLRDGDGRFPGRRRRRAHRHDERPEGWCAPRRGRAHPEGERPSRGGPRMAHGEARVPRRGRLAEEPHARDGDTCARLARKGRVCAPHRGRTRRPHLHRPHRHHPIALESGDIRPHGVPVPRRHTLDGDRCLGADHGGVAGRARLYARQHPRGAAHRRRIRHAAQHVGLHMPRREHRLRERRDPLPPPAAGRRPHHARPRRQPPQPLLAARRRAQHTAPRDRQQDHGRQHEGDHLHEG